MTTPDGRLLRRQGSRNRPLVGDAMVRFVLARGRRSAEEEAVAQVEPAMFDLELVNAALRGVGRPPVTAEQLLRALVDLRVADPQPEPLGVRVMLAARVRPTTRPGADGRPRPAATGVYPRRISVFVDPVVRYREGRRDDAPR